MAKVHIPHLFVTSDKRNPEYYFENGVTLIRVRDAAGKPLSYGTVAFGVAFDALCAKFATNPDMTQTDPPAADAPSFVAEVSLHPPGTPVMVNVRRTMIPATVTGRRVTAKGMFYITTDAAGVERIARPTHVTATANSPDESNALGAPSKGAAVIPASPRKTSGARSVRPRTLPGWPRGMPIDLAAAYVGLSESMLREQDIPRTWLSPGRMVFLREHLDAFLDRKAGIAPVATEADFDWDSGFRLLEKKPLTARR